MKRYTYGITLLFVITNVAVAQHASSSSAPGVLGNPVKTKDTQPPVISLVDDKGATSKDYITRGIKVVPDTKNRLEFRPDSTGYIVLKGTVEDNRDVATLQFNGQQMNLSGDEPTRKKFDVRLPSSSIPN